MSKFQVSYSSLQTVMKRWGSDVPAAQGAHSGEGMIAPGSFCSLFPLGFVCGLYVMGEEPGSRIMQSVSADTHRN